MSAIEKIHRREDQVPNAQLDLKRLPGEHILDVSPWAGQFADFAASNLPDPYRQQEEFLQAARQFFESLPAEIRRQIANFREHGNNYGALIVKNLPRDPELPPTPVDSRHSKAKATSVSERWLACFGMGLGEVFSYKQQNNGDMFHDIAPVRTKEREPVGENSLVDLAFHTDGASHPLVADYVMLNCLRGDRDHRARTLIAGTPALIATLTEQEIDALFACRFRVMPDYEFENVHVDESEMAIIPILEGPRERPRINFDPDLMQGIDAEAEAALRNANRKLGDISNYICFDDGDFAIIDNHRYVHGRTAYHPHYDGCDRWLHAAYSCHELYNHSRPLEIVDRVVDVPNW